MSELEDQWQSLRESLGLEPGKRERWGERPARQPPGVPYFEAVIHLGDGAVVNIMHATLESFEINQDFVDASVFGDASKVYLVSNKSFTIRGRV